MGQPGSQGGQPDYLSESLQTDLQTNSLTDLEQDVTNRSVLRHTFF